MPDLRAAVVLVAMLLPLPSHATVVIRSRCGAFGVVSLRIGEHNVGPTRWGRSVVNYESQLLLAGRSGPISGTTSVFWGGIAKWFTSSDGRYRYNADIGVSGGEMLKRIAFSSPKGTLICRLLEP